MDVRLTVRSPRDARPRSPLARIAGSNFLSVQQAFDRVRAVETDLIAEYELRLNSWRKLQMSEWIYGPMVTGGRWSARGDDNRVIRFECRDNTPSDYIGVATIDVEVHQYDSALLLHERLDLPVHRQIADETSYGAWPLIVTSRRGAEVTIRADGSAEGSISVDNRDTPVDQDREVEVSLRDVWDMPIPTTTGRPCQGQCAIGAFQQRTTGLTGRFADVSLLGYVDFRFIR